MFVTLPFIQFFLAVKYPVLIHTSLAFINPSCNRDLRARSGIRSGVYLIPPYRSNPTCFFRCKSRNHLSFYRRSGQKGDRIVIGYYRIVIKYYSVAPQRRACGRDPPKKKKKIKHYMLCLSYPQALKPQINY